MPALLSLPPVSLPLAFLGQQFEWGDMVIVGLLVLLEGVLSIDNALVLGLKLVADWGLNSDWSQELPGFEGGRRETVERYEGWLDVNWPLTAGGMKPAHDGHSDGGHTASDGRTASGIPHVPHLLDFHDLRRPECLAFWAAMAACFGIGFLPRRQHAAVA
jgi:hypothetical protein